MAIGYGISSNGRHSGGSQRNNPLTDADERRRGTGTDIIATMTIFGQLPSLKNRRRMIPAKGNRKPMLIKSAEAISYEQAFLMAIPQRMRIGYDGPVSVKVRVHYQSRRSDLSIEFLFDLLQKSGIIKNDNQIMHTEAWKGKDADNPRVHFTVSKWEEVHA